MITFKQYLLEVTRQDIIPPDYPLPPYLYHFTHKRLAPIILEKGLRPCPESKNYPWCERGVYLTNSPGIILEAVYRAELQLPEEDLELFEVNTQNLARNRLFFDPWWGPGQEETEAREKYIKYRNVSSFLYKSSISSSKIKLIPHNLWGELF